MRTLGAVAAQRTSMATYHRCRIVDSMIGLTVSSVGSSKFFFLRAGSSPSLFLMILAAHHYIPMGILNMPRHLLLE